MRGQETGKESYSETVSAVSATMGRMWGQTERMQASTNTLGPNCGRGRLGNPPPAPAAVYSHKPAFSSQPASQPASQPQPFGKETRLAGGSEGRVGQIENMINVRLVVGNGPA